MGAASRAAEHKEHRRPEEQGPCEGNRWEEERAPPHVGEGRGGLAGAGGEDGDVCRGRARVTVEVRYPHRDGVGPRDRVGVGRGGAGGTAAVAQAPVEPERPVPSRGVRPEHHAQRQWPRDRGGREAEHDRRIDGHDERGLVGALGGIVHPQADHERAGRGRCPAGKPEDVRRVRERARAPVAEPPEVGVGRSATGRGALQGDRERSAPPQRGRHPLGDHGERPDAHRGRGCVDALPALGADLDLGDERADSGEVVVHHRSAVRRPTITERPPLRVGGDAPGHARAVGDLKRRGPRERGGGHLDAHVRARDREHRRAPRSGAHLVDRLDREVVGDPVPEGAHGQGEGPTGGDIGHRGRGHRAPPAHVVTNRGPRAVRGRVGPGEPHRGVPWQRLEAEGSPRSGRGRGRESKEVVAERGAVRLVGGTSVVGDEGRTGAAVPGVPGPSQVGDVQGVRPAEVPVDEGRVAVALPEFARHERQACLDDREQRLVPAGPARAGVELVHVEAHP